jgi:hypothetical protein
LNIARKFDSTNRLWRGAVLSLVLAGLLAGPTAPVWAHVPPETGDPELDAKLSGGNTTDSAPGGGQNSVFAVPEINGPGRVSTVGNVWMKTTNVGIMGNPFTANSTDPSGQWPGPSSVEYLFFWGLWVAAKNPEASDPAQLRRVSHNTEWRPPTLAPEDRIYQSYEGQVGGTRDFNDDSDNEPDGTPKIDEDPLNGKDDDFDGLIDEDYAAISQLMYACEIRDDTEQAVNANFAEKHVPFGLLVRQNTYAFAVPGNNDFTSVEYEVINQSGHMLDSVFVGFFVEQDVGATIVPRYFTDDLPEPRIPQGDYANTEFDDSDPNFDPVLCPADTFRVRGFSMTDDDGDEGKTEGVSSFLLLGHTIDPTGVTGPMRVGFHTYAAYLPGRPYPIGQPTIDVERFESMSRLGSVDPTTGFIQGGRPEEIDKGDYFSLCSVGPYMNWQPNSSIKIAVALAVQRIDYLQPALDPADETQPNRVRYQRVIDNAIRAQKTYNGTYFDAPSGIPAPDSIGRETGLIAADGQEFQFSDCHDLANEQPRTVADDAITWFDLDCNYCTGVKGKLLRHWVASAPPPNPAMRLTAQDHAILIEWDNLSEVTPDPDNAAFDFYSYRVWKASNFTRPVGSSGPSDDLWALLAELKRYDDLKPLVDSVDTNQDGIRDSTTKTFPVLLNVQTGQRIVPNDIPPCAAGTTSINGACPPSSGAPGDTAYAVAQRAYLTDAGGVAVDPARKEAIYPIGRYSLRDPNVLNGFVYFYSVTGRDSSGLATITQPNGVAQQEGRRSATERDGIAPQGASLASKGDIYVVPNPYRGRAQWDLTPNAADPTGTHIDFFNMPSGNWTLRIFTISGDLVQVIRQDDIQTNGRMQQENAEDGQASWNLISRNGQDVVSGIYLFSVESSQGTVQGKFVIIR